MSPTTIWLITIVVAVVCVATKNVKVCMATFSILIGLWLWQIAAIGVSLTVSRTSVVDIQNVSNGDAEVRIIVFKDQNGKIQTRLVSDIFSAQPPKNARVQITECQQQHLGIDMTGSPCVAPRFDIVE